MKEYVAVTVDFKECSVLLHCTAMGVLVGSRSWERKMSSIHEHLVDAEGVLPTTVFQSIPSAEGARSYECCQVSSEGTVMVLAFDVGERRILAQAHIQPH